MDPQVFARPSALAPGDDQLSRSSIFGHAALGAAAVAGLGPRSGGAQRAMSDAAASRKPGGRRTSRLALNSTPPCATLMTAISSLLPTASRRALAMTYVGRKREDRNPDGRSAFLAIGAARPARGLCRPHCRSRAARAARRQVRAPSWPEVSRSSRRRGRCGSPTGFGGSRPIRSARHSAIN